MSVGLQVVRALLTMLVGAGIGGIGLSLITVLILSLTGSIQWQNDAAQYVVQYLFFSLPCGALLGAVTGLAMSLSFMHRLHAAGWVSLIGGFVLLALNLAVFWFWALRDGSMPFKDCLGAFCGFHGLPTLWAVALAARGLLFLRQ